jgi:exopolyphosphatase/guanosine-5'-triphosphate,3'-diphosphate pyrophosphatase
MASTALQRTNMKGLVRMRTEMIVPASILTEFVLRRTGIKSLSVSAYSLKEGVATLLARGGNIGRSDDSVL